MNIELQETEAKDDIQNGTLVLILENMANEIHRDARISGRRGDNRPAALRVAAQRLRQAMQPRSDALPV